MSDDRGAPISYLTLEPGTPVLASDGAEVGRVAHVLADADADIFDGIVLDTSVLPGGHKFVDAPQVDSIHEHGVVLAIDAAACEQLPEPGKNPATMELTGEDFVEQKWGDELEAKLKRAWDRISGKEPS
jgi:uncharacterized protein YrrD